MDPEGVYNNIKQDWFMEIDKNMNGAIEKEEFIPFVMKVATGHDNNISAHMDSLQEGTHNIRKLVELYKLNQLDYLQVCNLCRKIHRCFDFNGNGTLDKFETKQLLDVFAS